MFIRCTVLGQKRSVNMDKVFDFHPTFDGKGTVLHFDSSVSLCGEKHDHRRVTADQSYEKVCALLAEAGGRG
jgi:hypothetical protein